MKATHTKFDFASATLPSLADVRARVSLDANFPSGRRASVRSSLARLAVWSDRAPSAIAFAEPVIEGLFRRLRPDVLGISPKRLANALADVRFVLDLYGTNRRYQAPLTPGVLRLWDMLATKYRVLLFSAPVALPVGARPRSPAHGRSMLIGVLGGPEERRPITGQARGLSSVVDPGME